MPALTIPRQEAFAQALAQSLSPDEAAQTAGCKGERKQARARAKLPKFVERVQELKHERAWGGSRDLGPLIDELMGAVQEARKLDSAAAFVAVRGLIVEAARLKKLLPEPQPPPRPQMTPEEWMRKFNPEGWLRQYGPEAARGGDANNPV
ncbi:MAG: hypothetical protein JWO83_4174 [Caulobacteraceae bacterium]|nr:hypothetical protein [Caulobacteraceae bacterium]